MKRKPERPQITIRVAEESDMEFAHNLSKKAFSRYGPYEDILGRWFQSGTTETFLAIMEKRPLGFVMLGRYQSEWESCQIAELLAIAVEPEKRKKGVGDFLIQEVIRKSRDLGIETVVLYTALENVAAQRLFKKHGFTPSRIKERFYPRGQDALLMVSHIESRNDFAM
jgi:ribosomal protein S18 acetylase RimI-like enzyme